MWHRGAELLGPKLQIFSAGIRRHLYDVHRPFKALVRALPGHSGWLRLFQSMEKEKRRDRESIGLTYTTTHFHRAEFNLRRKKWEKFTGGQCEGECLSEPHNSIPPKADL